MRPHSREFANPQAVVVILLPLSAFSGQEESMKSENLLLENELLETAAGRAVYDALVQANIDLRSVSVELVKDMLQFE